MRLYQRGKAGTWWADFGSIGGASPRRSSGTADRAAAAEWAAATAAGLWRTQRLGAPARVTWDEAVVEWIGEHEHRRSIETIRRILRWLSARLQGQALADITGARIRDLAAERRRQLTPSGGPTSGATVNRHLAQLSAVLHYAHRRGWIAAVPAMPRAPEARGRIVWITHEQAARLLAELPPHLGAMAAFSLATGLRESNVRLLEWGQVDMARARAWVHGDQAKAGRALGVPLSAAAMDVLRRQMGKHRRWVFPVPTWRPGPGGRNVLRADAPCTSCSTAAWRKACIRAGLPTFIWHGLRHTWASWHVQAGTPLPVLQELGGWASLAMVQRYAHLGATHVAAWAGNIAPAGTDSAQAARASTNETGPEGPVHLGDSMGWLMGLEPTTTGITNSSAPVATNKIKHLRAVKAPKSA